MNLLKFKNSVAFLSITCVVLSGCSSPNDTVQRGDNPGKSVNQNSQYTSNHLQQTSPASRQQQRIGIVKFRGAKMLTRKRATSDSPSAGTIRRGARVVVLDEENDWLLVKEILPKGRYGAEQWIGKSFIAPDGTDVSEKTQVSGEALAAGAALGVGLIGCSLGGVVGAGCFGNNNSRGGNSSRSSSTVNSSSNSGSSTPPNVPVPKTGSSNTSMNDTALRAVRSNGLISGNPSHVIDCSWGSKTIIRKDGKWTNGTGYSYSDRTWSLGLGDFAAKLCAREV